MSAGGKTFWQAMHGGPLDHWTNCLFALGEALHQGSPADAYEKRDLETLTAALAPSGSQLQLETQARVIEMLSAALAEGVILGWSLHATQPARLEDFGAWLERARAYSESESPKEDPRGDR